ncbi:GNAT family N-acetyltransferase [Bradyrhizobium sp. CB82]|uniref:GNAT family N-acetyltransferase n=1 Tax=Bradyrhizobium sp. CB82 TaxID=3039159 RepID=UPI0032C214DF
MDQVGSYGVEFARDWAEASARWGDGGDATVFQHKHWLNAWYCAFDAAPLIAFIVDAAARRDIALVPLVWGRRHGVRVVEFADLGCSDYNAPILASDAPRDSASLRAMDSALLTALRALPERPDLIHLVKMPLEIRGRPNPLATNGRATACPLNGNLVEFTDDFEDYRASIAKIQLSRRWRVFTRNPGARFEIVVNVDEALRILDVMDRQQNKRMKELGERFVLDEPRNAKFYRDVVRRGLEDGYAVVSALFCGDEVVATTLGLRHGADYSLVRSSNAGGPWSNCSPSLLCIERTMAAQHRQGVRHFDLSIGNSDYKRRFGARPIPMTDVSIALSWRGMPDVLADRAVRELRRHPRAFAAAKRLRNACGGASRPAVSYATISPTYSRAPFNSGCRGLVPMSLEPTSSLSTLAITERSYRATIVPASVIVVMIISEAAWLVGLCWLTILLSRFAFS